MRIFKNKDTNHVIIVIKNKAWSFYGYPDDDITETTGKILEQHADDKDPLHACIEIELPAVVEIKNPLKETYGPHENKDTETEKEWKGTVCEHSRKSKNENSSTNLTRNSSENTQKTRSWKTPPTQPKTGSKQETSP